MKATSRTTNTQQENSIEFPVLMKDVSSELVVLFTSNQKGVVVVPNDTLNIGLIEDGWIRATDATSWTPFTGEITLMNQ